VQMSLERRPGGEQIGDAGLRNDRLQQAADQLAQATPETRSGQAAEAQRGESSSASIDGWSNSSISKWAST